MDRSFIVITAVASALMFAGVWIATGPGSASPSDMVRPVETVPMTPSLEPAKAEDRTRVTIEEPVRDAAPYNVTRSAYGEAARPVTRSAPSGVVYSGCREARAAGVTPLYRGSPGYGAHMDGDGDGIACEDYRP